MKKIFLVFLAFLFISVTLYLVYLNEVIFPEKIRQAVVDSLVQVTGKKISLASAKIDIFRGLVLKDLVISDENSVLLASKDISCSFLVLPVFKKQIVVTGLKLKSPEIALERLPDNSINIIEMFFKKQLLVKNGYSLTISKVTLSGSIINFKDDTMSPAFVKKINDVSFEARMSFPDRITFESEFEIPSKPPAFVKCTGTYRSKNKELSLDVKTRDLCVREFAAYFKGMNLELPDGRIDATAVLYFKNNVLDADIGMTSLSLIFSQDKISADLNCALTAKVKYNFNTKELIYTGELDMKNLALSNLDYMNKIGDIRGRVAFSDARVLSDYLTCTVLGVPVSAKIEIPDLHKAVMKITVNAGIALGTLESILKERFNINFPVDMAGNGNLSLALQYNLPVKEGPVINGSVKSSDALLKLKCLKNSLEKVRGTAVFTQNHLTWSQVSFRYLGAEYKTSGVLTNFEKPGLDLSLSSDRLKLQSLIAVNNNRITFSKLNGRYDNSEFWIQGNVDTADPSDITADITGRLKFDLTADNVFLKKFSDILKSSKLSGVVNASFALKGSLGNTLHRIVSAEISAKSLSAYGLKVEDFSMAYLERDGHLDIVRMHSDLYGGTFDATGTIDLVSKDLPFQVNADIKGLKIEKIKRDTAFRNADIAGSLQSHFGVKGFSSDLSKLRAWGRINIMDGKLWQLDLFRGIGALLFKSDFNSVMFKEGSCSFAVKDRAAVTNDILLKSDLLELNGVVKIGFDNSINASLKAEFTNEGIDAANIGNAAGAIERYGIIEVTGTLKNPNYKLRPDLSNVVSDIADNFFRQ